MPSSLPEPARAFFMPAAGADAGQRLWLHHVPVAAPRGALLQVHAFGEEMNKTRRMAALQSRAACAAGFAVLQVDLLGCGDSSGDFGDASWQAWVDDIADAAQWLRREHAAPLWLWGVRAGCLLAAEAALRIDAPVDFMFWQPPASGKPLLQQLLRLKAAADLQGANAAVVMGDLRACLARGEAIEVAGYRIRAGLAAGLEAAVLAPPPTPARLVWLELSTRADAPLLPASGPVLARWRDAGFAVDSCVVVGPAFWQTTETEDAPVLLDATVAALVPPLTAT